MNMQKKKILLQLLYIVNFVIPNDAGEIISM